MPPLSSERRIVWLVALVQFVNILDFVMVMPLGPDFAVALGFDQSRIGIIAGAYTAAAAVSGLLCATFLDRFDRRTVLLVALTGLVIGTASCALATDFTSLVLARIAAGAFGGPATAIGLSMVTDVVPPERRGRALGLVMSAFSIAAVAGVPAGLEVARHFGWWSPFMGVAALGAIVFVLALTLLPSLRLHLDRAGGGHPGAGGRLPVRRTPFAVISDMWRMATTRSGFLALVSMFIAMMAGFMIIPNISAFVQFNGGVHRAHLGFLYLAGGLVSLTVMNAGGRLVDRFGAVPVATLGTLGAAVTLALGFAPGYPLIPVVLVFMMFMGFQSLRAVSMRTLSSRVPRASERARFQSLQQAVTHSACAIGSMVSTLFLVERADHSLEGMTALTLVAISMFLTLPLMLLPVERIVRRQEQTDPDYAHDFSAATRQVAAATAGTATTAAPVAAPTAPVAPVPPVAPLGAPMPNVAAPSSPQQQV